MITRTFSILVLALVAGLALAAPSQADRSADLIIEDPAVAPGGSPDANQVMGIWRNRLGADWVRVQAFWDAVSPNNRARTKPSGFNVANPNDPRYDFASLDAAIARVRANGMRVMLTIHQFNPRWASTQPSRNRLGWKPNPRLYAQWASALAQRYGNVIDRYELGNEANQKVFLQPQTECRGRRCERSAANIYRELARAAYPAVKRTDRSADQVLIGVLAPIGAAGPRAGNLAPLPFIRAMGCLDDRYRRIRTGACRRFRAARGDGWSVHPYQVRERPTQPQRNPNLAKLGDMRRLTRVLDRLTRTRRIIAPRRRFNLYINEYGYETNPPDRRNGVTLGQQNAFLQQAAYIAWSTPRVKQFSQYLWRDDRPRNGQTAGFQTGLNTFDGQPKPAVATFPHPIFIDQRRGLLWGQVRPGGAHQVRILRQVGGSFQPFATVNTDGLGYFTRGGLPRASNYQFEYTHNGQTFRSDIARRN
jgi:hypothetical protein